MALEEERQRGLVRLETEGWGEKPGSKSWMWLCRPCWEGMGRASSAVEILAEVARSGLRLLGPPPHLPEESWFVSPRELIWGVTRKILFCPECD